MKYFDHTYNISTECDVCSLWGKKAEKAAVQALKQGKLSLDKREGPLIDW